MANTHGLLTAAPNNVAPLLQNQDQQEARTSKLSKHARHIWTTTGDSHECMTHETFWQLLDQSTQSGAQLRERTLLSGQLYLVGQLQIECRRGLAVQPWPSCPAT